MEIEIKVNNTVIATLTELQWTVLCSQINEDRLQQTIIDWIVLLLVGKYGDNSDAFKNEWLAVLQNDPTVTSVPTNTQAFVTYITSRPDYKTKKQKEES
jgi:hypothetical protein